MATVNQWSTQSAAVASSGMTEPAPRTRIGCKTVKSAEDLTPDIFPEESCPRLRSAAPNIIPLVLAHWACCKTGWTTLPLPDDDDDDDE